THRFVYEAPAPELARLDRLHHRVVGEQEVLRGVPARRRVAAGNMAARQALAQVNQVGEAASDALRAALNLRQLDLLHRLQMHAGLRSPRSSSVSSKSMSRCAWRSVSSGMRPVSRALRNTSRSAISISRRSRA